MTDLVTLFFLKRICYRSDDVAVDFWAHTQSSSQPMEIKEDLVWGCFVCAQRAFVMSHFGSTFWQNYGISCIGFRFQITPEPEICGSKVRVAR